MIEIKKTTNQISNCNVCGAINFVSELSSNKKVDNLTEILIGRSLNQQITLCDDCMRELFDKLAKFRSTQDKT